MIVVLSVNRQLIGTFKKKIVKCCVFFRNVGKIIAGKQRT